MCRGVAVDCTAAENGGGFIKCEIDGTTMRDHRQFILTREDSINFLVLFPAFDFHSPG